MGPLLTALSSRYFQVYSTRYRGRVQVTYAAAVWSLILYLILRLKIELRFLGRRRHSSLPLIKIGQLLFAGRNSSIIYLHRRNTLHRTRNAFLTN
jgi:hypothetical protein